MRSPGRERDTEGRAVGFRGAGLLRIFTWGHRLLPAVVCHMSAVGDDSDALTLLRCPVHLIPTPHQMHTVLSASEAVLAHLLCVP